MDGTENIFGFLILVLLPFIIWALFELYRLPVKNKILWLLIIIIWPLLGAILFLSVGRKMPKQN